MIANLEITVHIPHDEDIIIHCFETNNSFMTKWDTTFEFGKIAPCTYKVRLPGLHSLADDCVNRLKLIFTTNLPRHLPINVLIEYDYVFLRRKLGIMVSDIFTRYRCTRVGGNLALKVISDERDKKPEIFVVKPDENAVPMFSHHNDVREFFYQKYPSIKPPKQDVNGYDIDADDEKEIIKMRDEVMDRSDIVYDNLEKPCDVNNDINIPSLFYNDISRILTEADRILIGCLITINDGIDIKRIDIPDKKSLNKIYEDSNFPVGSGLLSTFDREEVTLEPLYTSYLGKDDGTDEYDEKVECVERTLKMIDVEAFYALLIKRVNKYLDSSIGGDIADTLKETIRQKIRYCAKTVRFKG